MSRRVKRWMSGFLVCAMLGAPLAAFAGPGCVNDVSPPVSVADDGMGEKHEHDAPPASPAGSTHAAHVCHGGCVCITMAPLVRNPEDMSSTRVAVQPVSRWSNAPLRSVDRPPRILL